MRRALAVLMLGGVALTAPAFAELTPEGGEQQANAYATGLQARPDIVHTGGGTYVVVWEGADDDDATGIAGRRFSAAGAAVGGDFAINSYTTGEQGSPVVDADGDGNFVVVWVDEGSHDGDGWGVFAQRHSAAGAPVGTEFQVNSYTTGDQYDADVGVAPDGSFVVVWESAYQDGDGTGVYAQRFDSAGDRVGGEFRVNSETQSYQSFPEVDVRSNGDFVVVWTSSGQDDPSDDSAPGVYAQRFNAAGSPLGDEFQVNQFTTGYQQAADVAVQPSGGFVIAWMDGGQFASHTAIVARRYGANGGASGDEFPVDTDDTAEKAVPRVAAAGDGSFTIVWTSDGQDDSGEGVYAQHFDANGTVSGDELRVNTATANDQFRPTVSADDTGSVVVAWENGSSSETEADISLQRYQGEASAGGTCADPIPPLVAGTPSTTASNVSATDSLFILRVAVALDSCELCVCDVDGSGSVAATDALATLRLAVGQPIDLECPAC